MAERGLLSLLKKRLSNQQPDLSQEVDRAAKAGRSFSPGLASILANAARGYVAGSQSEIPEQGFATGLGGGLGAAQEAQLASQQRALAERDRLLKEGRRVKLPKKLFGLEEDGDFDFNDAKEAADALLRRDTFNQKNTPEPPPGNGGGPGLTFAQKEVDKQFAKDYSDFVTGGGYADVNKNLGQLRMVKEALDRGQQASGPLLGLVPKGGRDVINPKGSDLQDSVEEVVQRNLRLVLGAQFTQKEGERLIERAYNPRQDEQTNAKRLERLIKQIDEAAKAKIRAADYYEKNGTLAGFQGVLYTSPSDFLADENTGTTGEPDQFGYVIGQSYTMKDGNTAAYIGNGEFE